jgi:DNA helicase IV
VEEYKLNSTFSNKKYYRVNIFTILFILIKLGYSGYSKYKYLYIDEAQDYNDVEIKLVSQIEAGSVLNVFGDNLDYYELNENYRNTINVVNYCNDILKLNMLGIVIDDGFKDNEKYVAYTRSLGDLEIYIKD